MTKWMSRTIGSCSWWAKTPHEPQRRPENESGDPDWGLFSIHKARNLPAVQWKLDNIRGMTRSKHQAARAKLEKHLGSI